jgi:hypothetical protein
MRSPAASNVRYALVVLVGAILGAATGKIFGAHHLGLWIVWGGAVGMAVSALWKNYWPQSN